MSATSVAELSTLRMSWLIFATASPISASRSRWRSATSVLRCSESSARGGDEFGRLCERVGDRAGNGRIVAEIVDGVDQGGQRCRIMPGEEASYKPQNEADHYRGRKKPLQEDKP